MSTFSAPIRFQLSEAEFRKAHQIHLKRSLFTIKNVMLLSIAFGLGAIQAQMFGGVGWAGKVFAGLWGVTFLFMFYAYSQLPIRLYRRNSKYQLEQEYTFNEDGIHHRQGDAEDDILWTSISQLVDGPGFLLIYSDRHLPDLLPKKEIGSAFELDHFKTQFLRKISRKPKTKK